METIKHTCTHCGTCCLHGGFVSTLPPTGSDVLRWRREGHSDVLSYIEKVQSNIGSDLWIKTGGELSRCPFVRKERGKPTYECTIYETRPEACM
jgi:Fe-S-cluster containining protein